MIPVSEYKNPLRKKLLIALLSLTSIWGCGCIYGGINEEEVGMIVLGAIIGGFSIYGTIENALYSTRVRKALTAADIEELAEFDSGSKHNAFLLISKNNLLGLFDKDTRTIALSPKYINIERTGNFIKIQYSNEKFGVFSCDLKKLIIPCEYDYADFSRDNCLRLAKESTIYKFSFSGELLDQHCYGEELDRLVDGLNSEQMACLAQRKDY